MLDVQLLRATAATLSVSWYSGDDLVDPATVTVTITRADGTAIVTDGATSGTGATPRTKALAAADTAELDVLTATWTSATLGSIVQRVEILGDLPFTISELRAFEDRVITETDYPDAVIEGARARILDEFERTCGVALVPRYRRVVLNGRGSARLLLPDIRVTRVRAIETREAGSQTWTAFTSDELADVLLEPWGRLTIESLGAFPAGIQNVRVAYEHGHARIPREISRAALIATRYELLATNVSDRAISISSDQGTTQLWTPGYSGRGAAVHELPVVDKVLRAFMERIPGIA